MVNYEQTVHKSGNRDGRIQRHRQWDCDRLGGAKVAVNDSSDRRGAERVAQAITDSGGNAIAVGADVSKSAEVARLFQEVDSAFGRLDVLVNNAGVFRFGAFGNYRGELSRPLQHQRFRGDSHCAGGDQAVRCRRR